MFTRLVTFTGAKDIDGGLKFVRDTVTPMLREQHGFRGITASVDRSQGVFGVLTLWDTEADRDASESAMVKVRADGATIIGGELTVEFFEELVVEIVNPPAVGASLLVRRISMDPAKIDENVEFFKREVLPQIKENAGFLAVRHMINRKTGEGAVGTVWADQASMEAAAETAEARRQMAARQGVTFGEQSKREIVFADLR
jgi:heme-degrading monooxygenase HmoA